MPKLHLLSAVFGFIVAGLLALTTSQASPPPAALNPASIRVEHMPHPRDMVQIEQGAPFTVPAGRLFVPTAMGCLCTTATDTWLAVDGQLKVHAFANGGGVSLTALPTGFAAPSGAIVSVANSSEAGRAWGYLASQ